MAATHSNPAVEERLRELGLVEISCHRYAAIERAMFQRIIRDSKERILRLPDKDIADCSLFPAGLLEEVRQLARQLPGLSRIRYGRRKTESSAELIGDRMRYFMKAANDGDGRCNADAGDLYCCTDQSLDDFLGRLEGEQCDSSRRERRDKARKCRPDYTYS